MENLFLLLATSLVLRIPKSKFKRCLIGDTGCSCYIFSEGKILHITYTKEGDKMYFNEQQVNGVMYGLITVQMKELYSLEQAEKILMQYINRCRKPFGIAYNISMQADKAAGQIIIKDYWQDGHGADWKIKGYTNGKTLAVLYVKNIAEAPVKEHDAFLDSFRFPAFS